MKYIYIVQDDKTSAYKLPPLKLSIYVSINIYIYINKMKLIYE